jgi:hypothetical protein
MRLPQLLPPWEALIVTLGNRNKCDPTECFKRFGRFKFVMLSYKDVVSQTELICHWFALDGRGGATRRETGAGTGRNDPGSEVH